MKFISWNVNGLRAVCGKGFSEVFTTLDADFFCLQETKMQEGQLDLAFTPSTHPSPSPSDCPMKSSLPCLTTGGST